MHTTNLLTRALRRILLVFCVAGLLPAAAQANLLTNGSFEAPDKVGGAYWLYAAGATAITGWTVVAPAGESIQLTPDTYLGLKASDGRQWLDLTGIYGYEKGVRSDAFATVVGQHYTLSFDVGNYLPFGPSTVGLSIDGGAEQWFANPSTAVTATAPMNWAHFSIDHVATSTSMQLTFLGRANGALSNNAGIGLDNVSVLAVASAVPEPPVVALMGAGLAACGAVARRRRMQGR